MKRSILAPSMLATALLLSACTGAEPEATTTTTIEFDGPEFETWQDWADWRMLEKGYYEDPVPACVHAKGFPYIRQEEGHFVPNTDDWEAIGDAWTECYAEQNNLKRECLVADGWKLIDDAHGGWSPEITPDRWPEYHKAFAICEEEIKAAREMPGFAMAELPWFYDALLESHACITRLNYEIDPPPPLEEWMATFHDPTVETWDPFSLIPAHRYEAIVGACGKPLS